MTHSIMSDDDGQTQLKTQPLTRAARWSADDKYPLPDVTICPHCGEERFEQIDSGYCSTFDGYDLHAWWCVCYTCKHEWEANCNCKRCLNDRAALPGGAS